MAAAKKPATKEAPKGPERITSANRKPLAPILKEGHVVKV